MPTQKRNQVVPWLGLKNQSLWIIDHKFSNTVIATLKKKKDKKFKKLNIESYEF